MLPECRSPAGVLRERHDRAEDGKCRNCEGEQTAAHEKREEQEKLYEILPGVRVHNPLTDSDLESLRQKSKALVRESLGEDDQRTLDAGYLLLASAFVSCAPNTLANFTALPRRYVRRLCKVGRAQGLFVRTQRETKLGKVAWLKDDAEPEAKDDIAFWLDVMCLLGDLERMVKNGEVYYRAAEHAGKSWDR